MNGNRAQGTNYRHQRERVHEQVRTTVITVAVAVEDELLTAAMRTATFFQKLHRHDLKRHDQPACPHDPLVIDLTDNL
jgi:hypothetical protein